MHITQELKNKASQENMVYTQMLQDARADINQGLFQEMYEVLHDRTVLDWQ